MGGIYTDEHHRTNISGLFAAGECACQYHGANRLGGNSMLGALYGGMKAAESACIYDAQLSPYLTGPASADGNAAEIFRKRLSDTAHEKLAEILLSGLAIVRDAAALSEALSRAEALYEASSGNTKKRCALGIAMLESALLRKESRGTHYRTDMPDRDDDNFRKTTVAFFKDGRVNIRFDEIPDRREIH